MRKLLTIGVMAALVTAAAAFEGTAGAQTDKPSATEVGVSPTEIRIAVAADVDNPFAPGLFQGAVDGVRAGADYVNSKAGGGGIAGRKVVVDFYDTKLSSNDARNATIKACQNDFAMVGGAMIGLSNADDITNCTDKAGQPTGLPDMPTIVSAGETCAPATFPAIGNGQVCNTTTHQIETWLANNGEAKWLLSQHKGIHGPMIVAGDSTSAARGGTAIALGWQKAGVKADQGTSVPVSALAPQSVFTPIIQKMKSDGSDFALMSAASNLMKEMRDEATLQGIDSTKVVWDCSSCYGNKIVTENSDSFEGTYQSLNFLPFDEGKSNRTLRGLPALHEEAGHAGPVRGLRIPGGAGVRAGGTQRG